MRYARGLRVFSIFEALGQRVPAAYWSNLAAMEDLPDDRTVSDDKSFSSTNLLRLRDAARRGQKGETVMLALICLGEDGPAQVDPAVLDEVMRSLGSVDMAQEARSLALEAMIGNGL